LLAELSERGKFVRSQIVLVKQINSMASY